MKIRILSLFSLGLTLGAGSNTENIALLKPTMESGGSYGANSTLANDGGYNPDFNNGSCSYSFANGHPYAWWTVDLGAVYRITHVVIARRTGFSLNDLHFEVYKGAPLICSHKPALCRYVPTEFSYPTENVTCQNDNAVGRYLTIRRSSGTGIFVMCEVEIYGELIQDQPTVNCGALVGMSKRSGHELTEGNIITRDATSAAACASECFSTGECNAFSANRNLSKGRFSVGFGRDIVTASDDWETYDFC